MEIVEQNQNVSVGPEARSVGPLRAKGSSYFGSASERDDHSALGELEQALASEVGGGRARRPSQQLTASQVGECIDACRHASLIGLPLNRFCTIDWESGGMAAGGAATGSFLKLLRDYLRTLGSDTACIWALENGPRLGIHVHILVHVPAPLSRKVSHRQRGWLTSAGARFKKGLIRSRPVGHGLWQYLAGAADVAGSRSFEHNLQLALEYVLKDGDEAARAMFPNRFQSKTGLIQGKRCGTSENIGRAARGVHGS